MDSTELQGNKESETNNQLLNLLGIIYFKSVLKLYKFVLLVPEIHICINGQGEGELKKSEIAPLH